jgi:3-oxoadipate enol-lactonase
MADDPAYETRRIAVPGGEIEVTVPVDLDRSGPIIAAAHPADAFGAGTAGLLATASNAQVVCLNPRGVGQSSSLAAGTRYAIEDMADEVDSVREALGIDRWWFWGLSGGGWIAESYAYRHPKALHGVMVESACACFAARLADPECLLSPANPAWGGALAKAGLQRATGADPSGADRLELLELPGVGSLLRRRNGPIVLVTPLTVAPEMVRAMPALLAFDARPWLGQVRVPMLVVCGSADPVVPLAHARAVHEAVDGSEFVVIHGAGHVPVTTPQRTEVSRAVRAFLARSAGR